MAEEKGEIVFWSLRQKFLDSSESLPEQQRQVMYYSLAIGHHVGVIDCLRPVLRCPVAEFRQWASRLDDEQARRKMLGVLTFGEIIIDLSHTARLRRALLPLAGAEPSPEQEFSQQLLLLLEEIVREPAIYLLLRRVDKV